MTGKASKKGSKAGRPKNSQDELEIWKELINNLGPDEVAKIFKKLVDEGDENLVEIIKQLPKDKTKLSSRKTGNILNISKLGICNFWNHKEKTNNKCKNRKEILIDKIYNIMVEYFVRICRKPLHKFCLKSMELKF